MHILHVVGARPNFMKVAPVYRALREQAVRQTLVHTGQHYDANMSDVFFQDLEIPAPDVNLNVGSGSHAQQTAAIMRGFEGVVLERKPDRVLVYGDVNSTVAAALVCAKLGIPVDHVEAGLRSFDRTMPEEVNRLVTDQLCDLLFTPSEDGDANLILEGVPKARIQRIGNVMIDTLVRLLPKAKSRFEQVEAALRITRPYVLVTLHRPSNVDDPRTLQAILSALDEVGQRAKILFPVHPRTEKLMKEFGVLAGQNIQLAQPLSYIDFLALQTQAACVITDSGGIQEETTYLGVPCITVRENTERPVTASMGTNILVGKDYAAVKTHALQAINGTFKKGSIPQLWDGQASQRIAQILMKK
jgi:UDP-N-acetylglucosamine 2-epimerase (non-hydrolysing)